MVDPELQRALRNYTKRIEEASMKFSVEVYAAGGDLFRELNGEEPRGPRFVTPQEAVQQHYESRSRRKKPVTQ